MPIFAKDNLGSGPDGLGYILTSMGAGAFISSIFIASLGDFSYKGILYLGGTALMTLFFGIFAISQTFPVAITFVALAGLFSTAFNTMQSTITLKIAPEDMRGRCMGFLSMAIGIYSLGSLAMGAIANIYGAGPTTAVSCAVLLLLIMIYSIIFPSLRKVK
jgi:predicted MFS family arabinose efflux permease